MISKTINKVENLTFNSIYHIYNKSVGDELLFRYDKDYYYFLRKLEKYILPVSEIYSYCLIPNHFHLLIKTKDTSEISKVNNSKNIENADKYLHLAFKNLFISYSKSYNKAHKRMGRLFLQPFKRILVEEEEDIIYLIYYMHRNPIHHGYTDDYEKWKYSSYQSCISNKSTKLNREEVLSFFGSTKDFISFHNENKTKKGSKKLFLE